VVVVVVVMVVVMVVVVVVVVVVAAQCYCDTFLVSTVNGQLSTQIRVILP